MKSLARHSWSDVVLLVAIFGLLVTTAFAGMPLVCQPFSIGDAASLPWTTASTSYNAPQPGYDANRLVPDTLALLTPETPVIVRMETLRRAALYAKDHGAIAQELAAALEKRARHLDGHGAPDALALFDYGYFAETARQAKVFSSVSYAQWQKQEAAEPGGYAEVLRAISMRGGDPQMEFAAALICAMGPRKSELDGHLRRAAAGAPEGSLLARNLVSHFENRGKTVAELRASLNGM
jgi:hypothetical protein